MIDARAEVEGAAFVAKLDRGGVALGGRLRREDNLLAGGRVGEREEHLLDGEALGALGVGGTEREAKVQVVKVQGLDVRVELATVRQAGGGTHTRHGWVGEWVSE